MKYMTIISFETVSSGVIIESNEKSSEWKNQTVYRFIFGYGSSMWM